jgi:hypothetical protein
VYDGNHLALEEKVKTVVLLEGHSKNGANQSILVKLAVINTSNIASEKTSSERFLRGTLRP